ncbi:unnamed protein product (macronuclear) [Paramecium tetraurelia]|uniref:RRM domain-containing protein n=1 Tax=Paramecium tetraurelia TaxID=5888 RepID=A0C0G4_PARTE|nr:uncharacterized protein GSPATT00006134001 [Paramecium tetraurelia]CAK64281.1 unnamed protein product [Paramecium tetraurelia]|eukprot:XP_001431679.1 hypothetical protein (macronuclear) [Paramecium tetraurelia strain d4-2]
MTSVVPFDQEAHQLNASSQPNETMIEDYDEFRRPPILEICLKHQSATQFAIADAKVDLNKNNLCPCCGQPIILTQLPLTASILDFSFNGPGVSLYFDFLMFSSVLISTFIIVCGIYDLIASTLGDTCHKLNTMGELECVDNFYSKFAKANQDNQHPDIAGSVLNFITTLILIILLFLYRKRINLLANKIDEKSILASDYSIIIENIPRDAKEEEIRQFFSKINNVEYKIQKICMGYQIQEYLRILKSKQEQEKTFTKILECERLGKPIPPRLPNKVDLTKTLDQLAYQLDQYEDNFQNSFQFSGVAIISYNTEDEANAVCKFFKATRLHLILSQVLRVIGKKDIRRFGDNVILVSKAPEPGDILWGNLGVTLLEQYKRKLITNLATIFLLGICFGILFGLSYGQFSLTDTGKGEQLSQAELIAITILGVVASVLISIINNILAIIIRKFAELEAPTTKTEYDISAAKKLGFAQFLNTAIITLIVNLVIVKEGEKSYYAVIKQGGLNQDVMLIFITNGIMPWLMALLDPFYLYRLFMRYQIQLQGQACNVTQQEANEYFAGPMIDLSKKYAQLGKTLLFTFFYAYLLPLGPVLSLGSLLVIYWVEKILLLRRDSKPAPTGSEMAEEMIDFFGEFTLLIYAIGCLVWESILNDAIFPLTWAQFAIAVLNFLVPIDTIFDLFWKTEDISTQEFYETQCFKFWDDYDRRNPITAEKAIETFLKNTTALPQQQVDGRGNIVLKNQEFKKQEKNKKAKNKHNKED